MIFGYVRLIFNMLLISQVFITAVADENGNSCQNETGFQQFMSSLNGMYLEHSSLYTGGMHFKSLGSTENSLTIYLALNNEFELIEKIRKQASLNNNDKDIQIYNTSDYLKRFSEHKWGWEPEETYKLSPADVLISALKVSVEAELAYEHINDLGLPYSFHYRQSGFDLDTFTSVGDPIDWWLHKEIPSHFSKIKEATWKFSKENDFIDWLQFVATSSAISHLQNWNFKNIERRKKGFYNLKKYAKEKWESTGSYAWLAALAEVAEENDEYSELILKEFDKISRKVVSCSAHRDVKAAYGMMLLNAVRLGYYKGLDVAKWLTPLKEKIYMRTKYQASNRINQLVLARESLKDYRAFWSIFNDDITSRILSVRAVGATGVDDFIINEEVSSYEYNDVELRFISMFSVDELVKIAEQKNISVKSKRMIMRTAFIREWVINSEESHLILNKLVSLEPEISSSITAILNINEKNRRSIELFKFVMSNPAFTYLLGVELYKPQHTRKISEFSLYNAEDGSWWCETNTDRIVNDIIDSTIRPFGLIGSDPVRSGGSWGALYYNPGQKRASLRKEEKIVFDRGLYDEIFSKLKNTHPLLNNNQNVEWSIFSKLPPAPILFYKKLHELDNSLEIDKSTMIDLYKLVIRSAKATCRKQVGVYQTLKKSRLELNDRYGVIYNG